MITLLRWIMELLLGFMCLLRNYLLGRSPITSKCTFKCTYKEWRKNPWAAGNKWVVSRWKQASSRKTVLITCESSPEFFVRSVRLPWRPYWTQIENYWKNYYRIAFVTLNFLRTFPTKKKKKKKRRKTRRGKTNFNNGLCDRITGSFAGPG